MSKSQWGATIAGLDIGTTKTCAVVATATAAGLEIIGVGEAAERIDAADYKALSPADLAGLAARV